jgi:hypothetical protein
MAVVALAGAVLVGCSGPGAGSGGAGSSGADAGSGAGSPAVAPGNPADTDRQVVTTASASVSVRDPAAGAQRLSEMVEAVGGRVDERTEQAGSGEDGVEGAVADLVVRVPADALTSVLADLAKLGDVGTVSVSRSDVTAKAVDLDARISALRTSVGRLQGLMDDAATTEALLAAEKALSERHMPFGVAPAGGPDSFLDGLGTGWRALVSALSGAAIGLGVLLPWLLVAGLLAGGVLLAVRLVRRRTPAQAPGAPQPPQG